MDDFQPMTFVVADDPRNAAKVVSGPIVHTSGYATARPVAVPGPTAATYVRAPHAAYAQPPMPYGTSAFWNTSPVYQQPPGYGGYPILGGLLGNLNVGDVIAIIGGAIAAVKKRPDAPTPTGDVATDVQNAVQFIAGFADHLDTRDRLREFSADIGKVLGAR